MVNSVGCTLTAKPASLAIAWMTSPRRIVCELASTISGTSIGVLTPDSAISRLAFSTSRPGHFRSGSSLDTGETALQPGTFSPKKTTLLITSRSSGQLERLAQLGVLARAACRAVLNGLPTPSVLPMLIVMPW